MIRIIQYHSVFHREWDEFVASCVNATFMHQRPYMDYHSNRFSDCSLMAYDEGKLLAVLPANRKLSTLYSHQGLTYGGWLYRQKHFDGTVMMQIMESAMAWMKAHNVRTWYYKPVPHIYHRYPAEEDLYALFRVGATLCESNLSTSVLLSNPLAFDRGNKSSAEGWRGSAPKQRLGGLLAGADRGAGCASPNDAGAFRGGNKIASQPFSRPNSPLHGIACRSTGGWRGDVLYPHGGA